MQKWDQASCSRDVEGLPIRKHIPLASMTTLGLGGAAQYLAQPEHLGDLQACLAWARQQDLPVWVLGGGSNVVIAEAGLPGLVVQLRTMRREVLSEDQTGKVLVRIEAGHDWDALVAWSVTEGLAGIECLSGIPGLVGAAPIQNIGAYGQELQDVFVEASVMTLSNGAIEQWDARRCGFAYRDSAFKQAPGQYLILDVTLELQRGGSPTLRYKELIDAMAQRNAAMAQRNAAMAQDAFDTFEGQKPKPSHAAAREELLLAREVVLGLRRKKSMVIDASDPDSRSAGSFFTNPIVSEATADAAWSCLVPLLRDGEEMPRYPAGQGMVKLSAAWLIERCGLLKGCHIGPVGISRKHTLALIHRGGGTTDALLGFARMVQRQVEQISGIRLHPEPVLVGMAEGVTLSDFAAPLSEELVFAI